MSNWFNMTELELLKKKIARLEKARKSAEEILEVKALELWESKQELERKVEERTKEIRLEKEKAEKAQAAEKSFLANMSHEIRTPLNAIIGMAHLLDNTQLEKDQKEYLNAIISSANILFGLISDILDISKIDAGKISIVNEDFDLHELAENLSTIFSPKAQKKGISFEYTIDDRISRYLHGDTKLINQVLINLIGNAVKFTFEGQVNLDFKLLNSGPDWQELKINVSDSGIGIKSDQIEDIFSQFKQAHKGIERVYGGTGLGLAISKKIVDKLGGILSVESTFNEGSNFYFNLKLPTANPENQLKKKLKTDSDIQQINKDAKILIVEDNPMNLMYLQKLIEEQGLHYESVNNGLEATKLCQDHLFDLIFMDIQMPVMDGYEATAEIRKIYKDLPIIALTANSLNGERKDALSSGFTDYVSKPYKPDHLQEILIKYL